MNTNVKVAKRDKLTIRIRPIKLAEEQRKRKREEIIKEILRIENA